MSKNNHPIEQEELMAYLDGELATNRAIAAAAHLEHCTECQELAADLRKISQELMAWEMEQPGSSSEISDEIVAALARRLRRIRHFHGRSLRRSRSSVAARRTWPTSVRLRARPASSVHRLPTQRIGR